ncbi:eukaryotic translation initiation factor 4E-binding protein [Coccinella septempunctata]|uniref:eukaryotic translation initiation factor 4E-binding protein n=1 Tax=Coccinella septempunctata TaxID=41139 RepID=UPI001D08C036|nr:eukaryotic translation initiation factor 4E-binding protein [Coccinella septempunctata]
MSASPMARKATASQAQAIPTRKVFINDPSELPSQYSSTPGGTIYSTTPGGTRIVYEKSVLMNLRNSPISKTPPSYDIPSSLIRGAPPEKKNNSPNKKNTVNKSKQPKQNEVKNEEGDQFHMDL